MGPIQVSTALKWAGSREDESSVVLVKPMRRRRRVSGSRSYPSDQEDFWAGDFGDSYASRNDGPDLEASNRWLFARALAAAGPITSVLELGANIGMNLKALASLYPGLSCDAVEINESAVRQLREVIGREHVYMGSLLQFDARPRVWDLVVCKGVLIHIAPEKLSEVYQVIRNSASRFVLLAEYYSPFPQEIPYRGHADRLFKRDFAGEFLDSYPEFVLRDYGFFYHRDPVAPQDDINWFLLERRGVEADKK